MLINVLQNVLLVLLFTWPAYVLPLILGVITLRAFRNDELSRLAGVFTLKPLVATPIWALIWSLGNQLDLPKDLERALTLVPGIGLTLLIVWAFRRSFARETGTALLFLGADALRWLSTLAWLIFSEDIGWGSIDPYYLAALILPSAYAVMALAIMWSRARRQAQVNRQAPGDPAQ